MYRQQIYTREYPVLLSCPENYPTNTDTMRVFSFLIAALTFFSGVIAVDIQKSVLISYPPETPDSVVDNAKKAIKDAGGVITHEYTLIK